jgi:hypothetical protein
VKPSLRVALATMVGAFVCAMAGAEGYSIYEIRQLKKSIEAQRPVGDDYSGETLDRTYAEAKSAAEDARQAADQSAAAANAAIAAQQAALEARDAAQRRSY